MHSATLWRPQPRSDASIREHLFLEASGGIGAGNLGDYATLDLDRVSLGSLTHSVRGLDMSLEVVSRMD